MIDDNVDFLIPISSFLRKKGYDVATTAKWEKVVNDVNVFNPDLILLDVFLDDHDGRDICRQIKSQPETNHIPIVMFSGDYSTATSCKENGADDFLYKPFNISELLNKVTTHL